MDWIVGNYIEIFGAVAGIIYVFLEIRQNIWLWPVGIVTSAIYIWVFFTSKFYADMSLQVYYLAISILGWYWWKRGSNINNGEETDRGDVLRVSRIGKKTAMGVAASFIAISLLLWGILSKFTDSPVPGWDSFITSLSIVATWMLARKIYEHWYLWIIVNFVSAFIFVIKGLYPTVILYLVYGFMSFAGLIEWKKSLREDNEESKINEVS